MKHEQGEQFTGQGSEAVAGEAPEPEPAPTTTTTTTTKGGRTRVAAAWVAALVALVVLAFLLVFILQNLETTTVDFLGFSGSLPLALAMLFSAIAGAVLVALLGLARMIQMRRAHRKATRQ